jgi:hypothetical protein
VAATTTFPCGSCTTSASCQRALDGADRASRVGSLRTWYGAVSSGGLQAAERASREPRPRAVRPDVMRAVVARGPGRFAVEQVDRPRGRAGREVEAAGGVPRRPDALHGSATRGGARLAVHARARAARPGRQRDGRFPVGNGVTAEVKLQCGTAPPARAPRSTCARTGRTWQRRCRAPSRSWSSARRARVHAVPETLTTRQASCRADGLRVHAVRRAGSVRDRVAVAGLGGLARSRCTPPGRRGSPRHRVVAADEKAAGRPTRYDAPPTRRRRGVRHRPGRERLGGRRRRTAARAVRAGGRVGALRPSTTARCHWTSTCLRSSASCPSAAVIWRPAASPRRCSC